MKIPFTTGQFLSVFEHYNQAIFPGQLFILLLGIFSMVLVHTHKSFKDKLTGSVLGLLWIWMGIVYHLVFFAVINPAARLFGALFILQGLLILYASIQGKLHLSFNNKGFDYIGYFFILFGMFIYPLIGLYLNGEPSKIISLGLPCPTTIFTFGLFILARNHFPKYLLIIPGLWAVVGLSAAVNLGIYQDLMLIIAALFAIVIILTEKRISLNYESSL
ncbi:MAG: DUF6064 family protein [Candidatus Saccharibacteria bacterium]